MDELILQPKEHELVSALHSGGVSLPMPFERDIFLLGIEVAGTSHVPNMDRLYEALDEGDRVKLVREPDNPYDEYAIRIDTENDAPIGYLASDAQSLAESVKLGYIPMKNNKVFARLMDAGKLLYGVVRRKEMDGEYHRIVVKIYLKD